MSAKVDLMTQPVFKATALTKTYVSGEVKVHALNNVDLEIEEKEVVVLLVVVHPSDRISDGIRVAQRQIP